ncbi:hypothetical protein HETIRDRAFT_441366 [Heterobasidion irregulare TC 32-1]|uniref:Endoplasmic reticulum junction formation protein lunapark n=1 Tax=Heterobasidion irregulare (strain TC 32-1) TaxID=747525 RepID=W4JVZ5_HETIT|nr:uncharacterized protein HETIRDRAFT_441366 [Heterobasidion irregulare TC 32-1]ETW77722.1 hypothetical protein HETIRDRAFT_441366 [Heterobasidion irregulare TC 32-1]
MSFISRWFKKTEPEDYEQILASLALDIQKRQTRLSEIRLRERRSTLLVTLWALGLWGLYVSFWYTGLLPKFSGYHGRSTIYASTQFKKTVMGTPVFLGPIVILFTRRIVQLYYTRIGDAEEQTLQALYKEQRTKVEDIKKKTNYYSTRNLIERYDGSSVPNSPLRGRPIPGPQSQLPVTPQRSFSQSNRQLPQGPISLELQTQLAPTPQQPMAPPRKQWFDKLADALLGDDESSTNIAASRYALICQKCFAHNGLIKESMWEDAQYLCPKCGHFNPSARSLKHGLSPQTPHSASSPVRQTRLGSLSHATPTAKGRTPSSSRPSISADHGDSIDHEDAGDFAAEGNSSRMDIDS